jgi:hypothetical protein
MPSNLLTSLTTTTSPVQTYALLPDIAAGLHGAAMVAALSCDAPADELRSDLTENFI